MTIDKQKLLFYVSLIWLIIPLYYSIYKTTTIWLFPTTILMGICYISCLYIKNKFISYFNWLYMLAYIVVYFILYCNADSLFMFMYITSLLNYNYRDFDIKSFRNITFNIAVIIVLINLIFTTNMAEIQKFLALIVIFFLICIHIATKISALDHIRKQKEYENNKYINTLLAENERNRIGRDLHDTLGHVFASLTLKTELALKFLEKENYKNLKQELIDINNITKSSMNSVREVISNLKFRTINEELALAKETLQLANISLEIITTLELQKMNPTLQSTISMIIKELVNNIIKHSNANKCYIKIKEDKRKIFLEIEDNGIGFDNLKNVELKSIKERLTLLKGEVSIINCKNPTIIKITIPYGEN